MKDEILKAYLAGWKACIDSLGGAELGLLEFDDSEKKLAEQCFREDNGERR